MHTNKDFVHFSQLEEKFICYVENRLLISVPFTSLSENLRRFPGNIREGVFFEMKLLSPSRHLLSQS